MNKCFLILFFDFTFATTVFHKFLEVSLFIEFVDSVVEAVEAKAFFLERRLGLLEEALLMIEIFAK